MVALILLLVVMESVLVCLGLVFTGYSLCDSEKYLFCYDSKKKRKTHDHATTSGLSLSARSLSMYAPVTTIRSTMSFPAANISSEAGRAFPMIPHLRRWKRATGVLAESLTKS